MTEQVRAALPQPGTRMTTEEFLALPETLTHIELVDGIVVYPHGYPGEDTEMSPSPLYSHQRTVRQAFKLIDVVGHGETLFAPMDLVLPDGTTIQPDVMWIAEDNNRVRRDKRLHGVPDLVVEVFSPSTRKYDKVNKLRVYQRAGIAEYWMIDPADEFVEICTLNDGEYTQKAYVVGESFTSAVLNVVITVKDFFG